MEKINPEVLNELERTCGAHCYHAPENCKCFGADPQELVDDLGLTIEEAEGEVFYSKEECAHYDATVSCFGTSISKATKIVDDLFGDCFNAAEKNELAENISLDNNYLENNAHALTFSKILRTTKRPEADQKKQFVYLLHTEHSVKIGASSNPTRRTSTLGTQISFEILKTDIFEVDDMFKAEAELHRKFKDVRLNGEWFKLTEGHVKEIKAMVSEIFKTKIEVKPLIPKNKIK